MTREDRIVEAFVELASAMVEQFDPVEFLQGLAERCVELLDCAEVGVLLADTAGALRVMASSSERTEALEILQTQSEEGPCFESFHRAQQVFSEDLAADQGRWPTFAPAAVEKGFRSVYAVPMRVRMQALGAMNFFRAEPGRIAEGDLPLGQGLADIAAVALVQERAGKESRGAVEQLQHALTSRVVIEQAKGMVAEQAGIDVDAAFVRLRLHAREHNRRLSEVAHDVVDGRLDARALAESRAGTSNR
ncbi:MAG: GAF and ANTAR domain-containing protein [Solirubrobacterales bacterium]|nr:GAF and ANTAR domain-containing protein [Solirubrobacterales bacterium]MBV9165037.1 GAF and ANTAR domain-containing protein [Solirubrobacterales bacterium]MBV9536769.1 GAF and ANTAR domain-containing protein [Solirubrobacterales bacterium]